MEDKEKKIQEVNNIDNFHKEENKKEQKCDSQNLNEEEKKEQKCDCSQNLNEEEKKEQKCDCSQNLNEEKKDELQKIIIKLEKEIKQLKKDLSQINQKLYNEKLKHQADLDNFKKRIRKENDNYLKHSSVNLISDLLVPLEQLEQVLEMPQKDPLLNDFLSGFKMINQQIKDILNKEGVQEIKALGEKFDPKIHHAIEITLNKNEPDGINIAVLQKGFLYKDLVIKPSMVKVNEWSDKNEKK